MCCNLLIELNILLLLLLVLLLLLLHWNMCCLWWHSILLHPILLEMLLLLLLLIVILLLHLSDLLKRQCCHTCSSCCRYLCLWHELLSISCSLTWNRLLLRYRNSSKSSRRNLCFPKYFSFSLWMLNLILLLLRCNSSNSPNRELLRLHNRIVII